jgi:hypothetical protein
VISSLNFPLRRPWHEKWSNYLAMSAKPKNVELNCTTVVSVVASGPCIEGTEIGEWEYDGE